MLRALSTHLFLNHRLHPGLLEFAARSGAEAVEIFAARQHFDYSSREDVSELASWFRSNPLQPFSMHAPLFPDREMGRAGAPAVNVLHPEKSRRIDAMDEIKRALESAEQVPFTAVVLSLGLNHSPWDEPAVEHSLTAIEHLKAFASPLGVRLLLENMENEVTTPAHLLYILKTGHFDSVGVCLDIGHLHLSMPVAGAPKDSGVGAAIELLGSRIAQLHLHDNHGPFSASTDMKDEHLWPGEGDIDWTAVSASLAALPATTPGILEIASDRDEPAESITRKAAAFFEKESLAEQRTTRA